MHVAVGDVSCVVLSESVFAHVSKTFGRAEELRIRITFLKQSKLFPAMSHAEVTDLAGKLRKETYCKNEILCRNDEGAECFFFILQGEVLVQYFPPSLDEQSEEQVRGGGNDEEPGHPLCFSSPPLSSEH